jgi:hypothetical protein
MKSKSDANSHAQPRISALAGMARPKCRSLRPIAFIAGARDAQRLGSTAATVVVDRLRVGRQTALEQPLIGYDSWFRHSDQM